MDYVLWIVVAGTALLAMSMSKRLGKLQDRVDELTRDLSIKTAETEELKPQIDTLKRLVERLAGGHEVDPIQVREGRLYRNVDAGTLKSALEGADDPNRPPTVIDVRTQREWDGGHIAGALHIPVDTLEKEMHQVPRDGRPLYMVCAGGGRSSSAAEVLGQRGYLNVHNVEGGMGAWRGDVTKD